MQGMTVVLDTSGAVLEKAVACPIAGLSVLRMDSEEAEGLAGEGGVMCLIEVPHGLTLHMIIATTAGVGLSVMLGAALMGLVFLSSGSGHDEAIEDPFENDPDLKP